jgi:hypothetical protein
VEAFRNGRRGFNHAAEFLHLNLCPLNVLACYQAPDPKWTLQGIRARRAQPSQHACATVVVLSFSRDNECMAPNRKQRALILQMNVVDRQTDQKVRSLLTLEKFAEHRDRFTEPGRRSKQDGRRERAMSTKKDIAPYSRK